MFYLTFFKKTLCFLFLLLSLKVVWGQSLPKILVHPENRYLMTQDGNPFFLAGDTEWELAKLATRQDVELMFSTRSEQGMNTVLFVLSGVFKGIDQPNIYGDYAFTNSNPTQPIITPGNNFNNATEYDFWDHVDYIIEKAEQRGLYVGLLPTWGFYVTSYVNESNAYQYGHFLGTRYRNKTNIIWYMGGDKAPYDRGTWRKLAEGVADGVNNVYNSDGNADWSTTLMSYHPNDRSNSSDEFHNDAWLDFNSHQSGHSARNISGIWQAPISDLARTPLKPVINAEPNYENHPVNWNAANGYLDAYDVRKALYWSIFAGSMGQVYGCQSVWQMYQPGRGAIDAPLGYWYDELNLPGARQFRYGKDLMLSRPYYNRIPDQGLLISEAGAGADRVQSTRATDGSYAMIYFPKSSISKNINVALLSGTTIHAWWYNPRDGKVYNQNGSIINEPFDSFNKANRSFDPPGSSNEDWVLVLDDASYGFPIPGTIDVSNPSYTPVASVSIEPAEIVIEQGETATVLARILPYYATNKNVTWASSNNAVVTVNPEGNIQALAIGTASITVMTQDGNKTATTQVRVIAPLREADNPANAYSGLDYYYYEGEWSWVPDYSILTEAQKGTCTNFDLSYRLREENFGFVYDGFIEVPTDGEYTFYLTSDDGSLLFIGQTLVTDYNGLHSASEEKSGKIGLKAGRHAITVYYFERTIDQVLYVKYSGPGIEKQPIPSSVLYRIDASNPYPVFAGYHKIAAKHSNKVLDVFYYSYNDGGVINQYQYYGSDNQKWDIELVNNGYFTIKAKHSNKVLTIVQGDQRVYQYSFTGADEQLWRLEKVNNTYFKIINKANGYALEVAASSTANEVNIHTALYTSSDNQLWTIDQVEAPVASAQLQINDLDQTQTPTLYPNPIDVSSKELIIDGLGQDEKVLKVYEVGISEKDLLFTNTSVSSSIVVNTSGLPTGLHVLKIKTSKNIYTKRLVIK